jgi:hypothetical protein
MGGRIELRAELICAERIFRRLEAMLFVGVDIALLGESLRVRTGPRRREGEPALAGAKVESAKPAQTGMFGVIVCVRSTYFAPFNADS